MVPRRRNPTSVTRGWRVYGRLSDPGRKRMTRRGSGFPVADNPSLRVPGYHKGSEQVRRVVTVGPLSEPLPSLVDRGRRRRPKTRLNVRVRDLVVSCP